MGNFNQYYAWLQPDMESACTLRGVSIKGVKGSAFAEKELTALLSRIYGRGIVCENAEFTVIFELVTRLARESFELAGAEQSLTIKAGDESGFLYGVYAFLVHLRMGCEPGTLDYRSAPSVGKRVLNHWDNMSGNIERGYAGGSLFFSDNKFAYDETRIADYARLLASVGVNEISINNVNVTPMSARLLTADFLPEAAKLAAIFRPYNIRLLLAADFEGPVKLGGLKSADPLCAEVIKWWQDTANTVYKYVPDLAGFVIKADSEFRDGPASLGRTQADGANVIARALKPHKGTCYWRCFVYNCKQDWRDTVTDRPKAAFEHFYPLDGKFDENVVLQIKNGPVDFQVREPNSPLLGRMKNTAQAIEFQVTQEYTGQQIDLYALAVQWEEFFARHFSESRKTLDLVGKEAVAITAVSNTGNDENWTGHLLAQANLYAFGRMAWQPSLTAKEVLNEWVIQTFGKNPELSKITDMLLASRAAYEKYTAPLGLGWMVNINHHYGPSPDGYEYMKWGTYHRADSVAIGVDRTAAGTGFSEQYDPWLAAVYNDKKTCPEELLLFFHRVNYDYRLKCGRTLLQYIYDTRFEGAEVVKGFIGTWESLKGHLPECAYLSVLERLKKQLENAEEWRDVVNTYFYRKTGIGDEKGRRIYT